MTTNLDVRQAASEVDLVLPGTSGVTDTRQLSVQFSRVDAEWCTLRSGRRRAGVSPAATHAATSRHGEHSDESVALTVSLEKWPAKRRGRPPTTGVYSKLAAAKQMLLEVQRQELELAEEKRALDPAEDPPEPSRSSRSLPDPEDLAEEFRHVPTVDLAAQALEFCTDVERVAGVSKGLKGTLVRKLRMAARHLKAIHTETAVRAVPARAGKELDELRRQLKLREQNLAEVTCTVVTTATPVIAGPKTSARPDSPLSGEEAGRKRRNDDADLFTPEDPTAVDEVLASPAPALAAPAEKSCPEPELIAGFAALLERDLAGLSAEFQAAIAAVQLPPKRADQPKGVEAAAATPAPSRNKAERRVRNMVPPTRDPQPGPTSAPASIVEKRMARIVEEHRRTADGTWVTVVGRRAKAAEKKAAVDEAPPAQGSKDVAQKKRVASQAKGKAAQPAKPKAPRPSKRLR
ncbi:uncharacterized protein LOC114881486 [Osmia bicornis bicornis]|uniref:uncharacterized protein LOC114881486 n=1 Tax=Osmia bicornis bicornis TaxID=1437191 RepID=UPI001EAEBBEB|nr:uncharacterized protein LOC114881486 [Osmia bicornis bicornis]